MKYKRLTTTMVVNEKKIKTVKSKVTIQDLNNRLCELEDKIETESEAETKLKELQEEQK